MKQSRGNVYAGSGVVAEVTTYATEGDSLDMDCICKPFHLDIALMLAGLGKIIGGLQP